MPLVRELLRVRRLPRLVPRGRDLKLGKGQRYRFDYTACTGCGACLRQCPVHAIELVPEQGLQTQQVWAIAPGPVLPVVGGTWPPSSN